MFKQACKDKSVFTFSKKNAAGKYAPIPVGDMKQNLCTLIESSFQGPHEEKVVESMPLLVGKRIKHTFEQGKWNGRVISVVPGFPDWYNCVYDEDTSVYTYRLLEDYRHGQVRIIV